MLNSKQFKASELLAFNHLTQEEVSQEIGVHKNSITNWKKNPEFLEELEKALRQNLKLTAIGALRVIVGLLNSPNEQIRLSAAKDILDRAGFKPGEYIEVKTQRRLEDILAEIDYDLID